VVSLVNDRSGPEAASESLATTKSLDAAIMPRPTNRPRFNLDCVLERRRASLDLDRLLGVCRYPEPLRFVVVWDGRDGGEATA
jgi:hypothetical protein